MRATQIVKIRYSINTDGSTTAEEHNRIQALTEAGTGEGPKLVGTRNTGTENTYLCCPSTIIIHKTVNNMFQTYNCTSYDNKSGEHSILTNILNDATV
jgi:hypothetical protein